ncbi:HAD family hydrolase [Cellvibrio sp. PSBB006]|uniref:HAD family hydrolase n=1 Tax=Cellvibrio sp. PSBB006 TaxID=1987723 RepID=UPI001E3DFEFC|nr:HAD-IA family hydrolase [Cellvibrio sp. PSBB006]
MSPSKPIRAVMFDLDGTLLDTAPDFIVVLNQLLEENQRPALPADLIRASVSNGARALVSLGFGIDDQDPHFERLRVRLLELYALHIAVHTQLFPGINELLSKLQQHNIAWGIATNKPSAYTHQLLKALPIQPPPISIICPEDVKQRKPHPESMFLASQHVGCQPDEIVYIGDHKRDIDCGREAGAITIAAAYGYIEAEDNIDNWQADYCVNHADEIWPILENLMIASRQLVRSDSGTSETAGHMEN